MKFHSIKAKNLKPYQDVEVDLTALPGILTAVQGPNGAGKSLLLGFLGASLYREVRTHATTSSLAALATSRDACLEVTVSNGSGPYTLRHLVDGVSGKSEAVVLDAAGQPLISSTKVTAFDQFATKHFPPADQLYATQVSVQSQRPILEMTAGERKELLLEMIGQSRLEALAESARERAKEARAKAEALQRQLAAVPAPDLAALEQRAASAAKGVGEAEERTRGARVALDRAKAAAADAQRHADLVEQRGAALRRLKAAEVQLADLQERIANNRKLLERGEEIRAAQARAAELDQQLSERGEVIRAAEASVATATSKLREAQQEADRAADALSKMALRQDAIAARLRDRLAVENAVASLHEREATLGDAERAVEALEERIAVLHALAMTSKDQRIGGLRHGLESIASADEADEDGSAPAGPWARNVLASDDELAAKAAQAPRDLEEARSLQARAKERERSARESVRFTQAYATRKPEIDRALADQQAAEEERTTLSERLGLAAAARTEAEALKRTSQDAEDAIRRGTLTLRQERAAFDALLKQATNLDQAQTRIEAYEGQLPAVEAGAAQARAELATLPEVEAGKAVDLVTFEREVTLAEHAERAARAQVTEADLAIKAGQETLARRAALDAEVRSAEAEVADWVRLDQDIGPKGLIALAVDSAVPEINDSANLLLHACFSSRFSVEIVTTKLSADGKKTREGLDIRVLDQEKGRDALAEEYSGGEFTIIGEAISLAMTMYTCRLHGSEGCSIVRDESGAALDTDNGRAYVRMLRLAGEQLGASRILWVTHSPELAELADSRLIVADGTVRIA